MLTGALATIEKLFWAMVWVVFLMIAAYWLLGLAEDKGGDSILGKFATGVSNRLRPQG